MTAIGVQLLACQPRPSRDWSRAEALWQERDPTAFRAWTALDGKTSEGAAAHQRLADADAHFRRGIQLLASGTAGAREELLAGNEVGPMDPALYLPLGRACRARDLSQRAAEFYRKFLKHEPQSPDAAAARSELAALDDGLDDVFAAPERRPFPLLPVEVGAGALATIGGGLLLRRRRRERKTLAELAQMSPELQPAIAFLVGCLRHELLKQRILVAGEAILALDEGALQPGQREFLLARLFQGEPLALAWAGMLASFMRALGPRFDLQRSDPAFRDAGRAIAEIASLRSSFAVDDPSAVVRLRRAYDQIVDFDRSLARLLAGLTHTLVDDAFLTDTVARIRGELGGAANVKIAIGSVPRGVAVEIYRMDLELVLANLLRNAIVAAMRADGPARVAVAVTVVLEPTGEETVRIQVSDTNPELLPLANARDVSRGLGLVKAALARYDGSLEQCAGEAPFAKSVTARLFRALDSASSVGEAA